MLHLCLQRHFLCEVQFVCQYFYKESLYPNDVALYQKKLTLSLPALGYWVGMLTVLSSHNPTNSWPETSFMTSLECDFFQVFTEIKLLCQIHWCQKSIDQNVMQPEGSLKFCIVMWIISQRKKKSITTICAHVVRFCSSFNYSFAISDGLVVLQLAKINRRVSSHVNYHVCLLYENKGKTQYIAMNMMNGSIH